MTENVVAGVVGNVWTLGQRVMDRVSPRVAVGFLVAGLLGYNCWMVLRRRYWRPRQEKKKEGGEKEKKQDYCQSGQPKGDTLQGIHQDETENKSLKEDTPLLEPSSDSKLVGFADKLPESPDTAEERVRKQQAKTFRSDRLMALEFTQDDAEAYKPKLDLLQFKINSHADLLQSAVQTRDQTLQELANLQSSLEAMQARLVMAQSRLAEAEKEEAAAQATMAAARRDQAANTLATMDAALEENLKSQIAMVEKLEAAVRDTTDPARKQMLEKARKQAADRVKTLRRELQMRRGVQPEQMGGQRGFLEDDD